MQDRPRDQMREVGHEQTIVQEVELVDLPPIGIDQEGRSECREVGARERVQISEKDRLPVVGEQAPKFARTASVKSSFRWGASGVVSRK